MDNNEVYSLFEVIKNDLKSINGKLENAPKVTNNQSGGQPTAVNVTPIKELFESSAKEHQAQTKAMLTKFGEAEVKTSNRILGLLRDLKELFITNSEERKDEPQEHIHRHQFDIKSNRVFSLLVGMGIVCSFFRLGQHRALEIQATVCGRCAEVPCHPLMGRLQRQSHPMAERRVRHSPQRGSNRMDTAGGRRLRQGIKDFVRQSDAGEIESGSNEK